MRAHLAGGEGDLAAVLRHTRCSLQAFRDAGAIRDVVQALGHEGLALADLGLVDEAERCLKDAAPLALRHGLHHDYIDDIDRLAWIALQRGQWDEAARHARAVAEFAGRLNIRRGRLLAPLTLALIASELGSHEEALRLSAEALEQAGCEADWLGLALPVAARCALRAGLREDAMGKAEQAVHLHANTCLSEHLARTHAVYCECLLAVGRTDAARVAIADAHGWLLRQASLLAETERRAFLEAIREHVQIRELAATWLDAAAAAKSA
jgi:tetratricopeptide (TPR) repeat protein